MADLRVYSMFFYLYYVERFPIARVESHWLALPITDARGYRGELAL